MKPRHLLATLILAVGISPAAHAINNDQWANISDVTAYGLLGAGLAAPTLRGDWQGLRQAAFSIGSASGVATLGKAVFKETRPDRSDRNSFPSGHTSVAFASATTLHRRYGWEYGVPAYALATLTGTARVAAKKHFWWDVVAGAAIGTTTGWFFTEPFNNKVQLVPWADSKGAGVLVGVTW